MSLDLWTYNPVTITQDHDASQLGDFEYTETKESGKEQYSPGASTANRVFLVNWDVRPDFLDDLLGYAYLDNSNNIIRVLPDEHPEIDNFFCEDAQGEGIGVPGASDNNSISWTLAKINANYKPRPYAVLADDEVSSEQERFTSRTTAVKGDYLTLQNGMKFVTSGRVLNAPPGKVTMAMEVQYTWHSVPALYASPFTPPNMTAINNCLGRVNSAQFDPSGFNAPPGTILCLGIDPKMVTGKLAGDTATTPIGNFYWEITMIFSYRNNGFVTYGGSSAGGTSSAYAGHNFCFDIQTNLWDLVTPNGLLSGPTIYSTADLNTLWDIG